MSGLQVLPKPPNAAWNQQIDLLDEVPAIPALTSLPNALVLCHPRQSASQILASRLSAPSPHLLARAPRFKSVALRCINTCTAPPPAAQE